MALGVLGLVWILPPVLGSLHIDEFKNHFASYIVSISSSSKNGATRSWHTPGVWRDLSEIMHTKCLAQRREGLFTSSSYFCFVSPKSILCFLKHEAILPSGLRLDLQCRPISPRVWAFQTLNPQRIHAPTLPITWWVSHQHSQSRIPSSSMPTAFCTRFSFNLKNLYLSL